VFVVVVVLETRIVLLLRLALKEVVKILVNWQSVERMPFVRQLDINQ